MHWGGVSLEDPRGVSMGLTDMDLPGEEAWGVLRSLVLALAGLRMSA